MTAFCQSHTVPLSDADIATSGRVRKTIKTFVSIVLLGPLHTLQPKTFDASLLRKRPVMAVWTGEVISVILDE
jgi:hypothetical protein